MESKWYGGRRYQVAAISPQEIQCIKEQDSLDTLFMNIQFHRKIIDEFHGDYGVENPTVSASANFTWCVSGTPLTSIKSIFKTSELLGLRRLNEAILSFDEDRLVEELKTVMIRHTKSQQIDGEDALALPDSRTEKMWVNFTAQERTQYAAAARQSKGAISIDRPAFTCELSLTSRRQICADLSRNARQTRGYREKDFVLGSRPNGSKTNALVADLQQLRQEDPAMHVIVFSHYELTMQSLAGVLESKGFNVLKFSGSVEVSKRRKNIKEFQENLSKPTVMVATMKVGNVGVNLTAATRVYLFENSFNPQQELQAAGRIHRLGQTKPCLVKKLLYRESIESTIDKLHVAIQEGKITLNSGNSGYLQQGAVDLLLGDKDVISPLVQP